MLIDLWNKLDGKKTTAAVILSIATGALTRHGVTVPTWLPDAIDWLLALGLAHKGLKLVAPKAPAAPPAPPAGPVAGVLLLALSVGLLGACAAPASSQGQQGQGGAVTAPPYMVTINIGTGGGVATTLTSAPVAAPKADSQAQASQTASTSTDVSPAVGDSAIKAASPLKTIGGTGSTAPSNASTSPREPGTEATPPATNGSGTVPR